MNDNDKDPQLQAPQEANTGKHINFREVEENDNAGGTSANSADDNADSPTKKAWEELRNDSKNEQS